MKHIDKHINGAQLSDDRTDSDLKRQLRQYDPEVKSDAEFMSRLNRSLDMIESVKSDMAMHRSRYRRAIAAASIAGFVVGYGVSRLLPLLDRQINGLLSSFSTTEWISYLPPYIQATEWLIIGIISVTAATGVYRLAADRR